MPNYERNRDGGRIKVKATGEGTRCSGSYFSHRVQIGQKVWMTPTYIGEYINGEPSLPERARLDEIIAKQKK